MPGKCKFQNAWLSKAIYKDWLAQDTHDIHFARCRACCKSIKLQTMGEAALTSHAGGAGHKAAVRKLLEAGNLTMMNSNEQRNGGVIQTKESKKEEEEPTCVQREVMDRVEGGDWSDLHHSPCTNSTSHNAELQDVAYPVAFFTAPGTSRLISQHLRPSSTVSEEGAGRRSTRRETIDLSRTEQQQRTEALELQMRLQEWENRMKVLAWEQELVREKRRAVQQEEKAFRMKAAYYKAKLKRMGEDVPASSSSSEEEETMSNPTG